MNITTYNVLNAGRRVSNKFSFISVSKGGQVTISKAAMEEYGLELGDKVAMSQDEDEPINWYLTKDKDGFEIRLATTSGSFGFNNSFLCAALREAASAFKKDLPNRVRFMLGELIIYQKKEYITIITSSAQ